MAARYVLDNFDLYQYVRVAADDGLSPQQAEMIAPQFSDSAVGDGDPLINIRTTNREFVLPVHLTPAKDVSFAVTKDGLHAQVADLNRRLRNARQLEWRDDGATVSTYLQVEAARFE